MRRVHCGCIVSVHAFTLLDAGAIECTACARKNVVSQSSLKEESSNPSFGLAVPYTSPDEAGQIGTLDNCSYVRDIFTVFLKHLH
ncbi:hypothetical protein V6N12_000295 [Hibiscus sabdariffa]|uniref:VAL1-3 N-terminal zinc finger domain-containing protein n=1 Tax=Hibiscus sabdariffa TaxID=183260 RepID=A0ABR1ZMY2_9ROSI